jgi:hypothetical protein
MAVGVYCVVVGASCLSCAFFPLLKISYVGIPYDCRIPKLDVLDYIYLNVVP